VSGQHQNTLAIGQDDVLSLPRDPESSFLQCPQGIEMVHPGNLRHDLCPYLHFADFGMLVAKQVLGHGEIFLDRVMNIGQSILLGGSL
jgi:hypothetical protein